MNISKEQIQKLTEDIEQNRKKTRRRAWLLSAVPLILAAILLGYTVWQIQISSQKLADVQMELDETSQTLANTNMELSDTNAQLEDTQKELNQANDDLNSVTAELNATKDELEKTREELEETKEELNSLKQDLQSANLFVENYYEMGVLDVKGGYPGLSSDGEAILTFILDMQWDNVGWNRYGFSVEEGFNSPSFVIYVLQQFGLISENYHGGSRPWDILEPISRPSPGDLVYYEGGYTMFYYEDRGESFVIGMTPLGIISQELNFAPVLGYLRVPYRY